MRSEIEYSKSNLCGRPGRRVKLGARFGGDENAETFSRFACRAFCGRALCRTLCGRRTQEARQAKRDRKSTRLNSSHVEISYAVFCLKKKKTQSKKMHVRLA